MPSEESLIIVQDELNKYHFKTKDDQRVNIEHKNQQIILDLFKWGEEASLQISLDTVPTPNHTFSENKIEVENPDFLLRVYPIDARSTGDLYEQGEDEIQCHDGGLRFELVLKKKRPAAGNSFLFPISAKNLRFSYQPFLNQEDIDDGVIRPLNVEGSYAVYHITKKDNQYMSGKAFHIYRPIAEDALGDKAMCSIEIDKYIDPTNLTLTIPQQFLDEATYPITIDPDFGYTAIGGSATPIAHEGSSRRRGSAWPMPAPGGTANYIRARLYGNVSPVDCKVFINQKDSGGAGTHGQIAGPVENLACIIAGHWEEFTLGGEVLTQAIVYILNILGDGSDVPGKGSDYFLYFDVNGAIASYYETQTYGAPESPWVVAAEGTTNDYSIFCNYTDLVAGWTGKISGVTNPAEIAGVAAANIAEVKGVA